MAYQCPYCQSEKHPVEFRQRTLLGHVCFGLIVLAGVAGLLWWAGRLINARDGDMGLTLFWFAPALILLVASLLLADNAFRETFHRCPQCRRRILR